KYNKLPNWIWSANVNTITKFIEGFFDGYGYEDGKEIHINDEKLAEEMNLLMQLIGVSTTLRYRDNSQVIRIQNILGRGLENDKIIKDKLHNLVPGFLLNQNYVKGENRNNLYQSYDYKMVSLTTIDRRNLSNEKIESLRNSDFAVTEIKNIEKEDLSYQQEFYDIELEKNHYFVHSDGNITHNCCRLRLDNRELKKRGGGLFGANPMTGSIGVVTLNMPRIGYLSNSKEEYMERVYQLMDLAKESLEIKRAVLENLTEQGLYPYARFYLRNIKKRFDEYWKNHFNTIGINGMNESLINFMGENITDRKAYEFTLEVMQNMKLKMQEYQTEKDNLYNLEATPAESTSYRLARIDKQKFGDDIIAANENRIKENNAEPYYTNSTHLPVGYTRDIFDALEFQDELQAEYTGGCIEKGNKIATDKGLLKIENIVENLEQLKPIKAISYNTDNNQAEWDLITDAMSVDVSKNDKIRIKAEKGLDITTSDWHPFFVVVKHHVENDCPVCGEEISSFATHMSQYQVLEKRADELETGDYILQNNTNLYPVNGSELDKDLMWLIGYFLSAEKVFENDIKIIDKKLERINRAAEIINNEFNSSIEFVGKLKSSKKVYELSLSDRSIKEFLSQYNLTAKDKVNDNEVPKKIKEQITQNNIYNFLTGLLEIERSADKNTEYHTEYEELADDILEICSKAGIVVYRVLNNKGAGKKEFKIKLEDILDRLNEVDNNTDESTQMNNKQFSVVKVLEANKVNVEDNQFYDLTTEKHHNYLAGKNTFVFIHNTVFHGFLGERLNGIESTKKIVKRISANFKLPYYTITPTFSICPVHGYLAGEHHYCPKCEAEERASQNEDE
ncbi:MAG: anaerobic ribonucleoside-triphosphate reductase, partial [Halanaerobiales bacterium]